MQTISGLQQQRLACEACCGDANATKSQWKRCDVSLGHRHYCDYDYQLTACIYYCANMLVVGQDEQLSVHTIYAFYINIGDYDYYYEKHEIYLLDY